MTGGQSWAGPGGGKKRRPASPNQLDLPDVLQFMQLLWAVVHGLEKTSKRMTKEIGVTGPQRLVLRVVGLFPGVSAGTLAAILHIHPSTLTGILQRLVAQRLVVRISDSSDRRRAVLCLTAHGSRANGISRGTVERAVSDALAAVNRRDRLATKRVLENLYRRLDTASSDSRGSSASFQRRAKRRAD